jgi:hypothetical protein
MSDEIRMSNDEWAKNHPLSSPNGAKHTSPGQRPGSRSHRLLSPEGAAHFRPANPRHGSPLQGSESWRNLYLGRCPRLAWIRPLALKNGTVNMEVMMKNGILMSNNEIRISNDEWAKNHPLSSPNGAKHTSPGQRPGSRSHRIFSPEGAAPRRGSK